MEVKIHAIKTYLFRLLRFLNSDVKGSIAKVEKRIAKFAAHEQQPKTRVFGSAKGKVIAQDDFNDAAPEIESLFYEGELFPKVDASSK